MNNPRLRENAQKLRREVTKEERRLWYDFLKQLPVTVNRQKVIEHALNQLGITVVRYSNDDVNRNFDGVCADLFRRLALTDIEQT